MEWNNFITQAEINKILEEVKGDTTRWFLHPFEISCRFKGEGRERDLIIDIKTLHRSFIACLA